MSRYCPSDQGFLSKCDLDYSGGFSACFSVQGCVKLHQVAVMVSKLCDPARAPWITRYAKENFECQIK